MMELWDNISYMVELDAACILFMLPVRKRNIWPARVILGIVLTVVIAGFCDSSFGKQLTDLELCVYLAAYILLCILFVALCSDISWTKTVFCAICACAVQHVAFDMALIYWIVIEDHEWVMVIIYAAVYLFFYWFIARKLPEQGDFIVNKKTLYSMAAIIVLVWGLSVLEGSGMPIFQSGIGNRVIFRIMDAMCCFYMLWVQVYEKEKTELNRELDGINNAWRQQNKQYGVTQETIDSINRKCHDLKHQIRALREMKNEKEKEEYLDELENDILIYDTAIQTGNRALDVVLMDKGLFCKTHDIQWSCMADASKLGFMKLEDIYAIFGNALDNAIEAVLRLTDTEKRVISVKIITQGSILMIQIQNYYDAVLQFEEGIPVTTHKNKQEHGYGMKSIRYIAEKYNGTITVDADGQIFMLQILFPIQDC